MISHAVVCHRVPKCGVVGYNGSGFGEGLAKVARSPVGSLAREVR